MSTAYDRLAPRYDKAIAPLEKWFLRNLRSRAIAKLPPKGLVLELGAGTGLNFALYSSAVQVVATEPSTEMLRLAQLKIGNKIIKSVQCYGEQLPFADDSFDAALVTLVMCSVKSPEQVFAELRRVVRKGGTISLLEHVRPPGLLGPVFDLLNAISVRFGDDHFNRRTVETAAKSGLQITKVKRWGLGIFNIFSCVVVS